MRYCSLLATKVAGVKVYPRQTWNFRSHAVSACSNHMIGPWCHRLMHVTQADACMYHRDWTCLYGMYCMHCPVKSQADACRYCMGSKVSSLSRIYLYSSYFDWQQYLIEDTTRRRRWKLLTFRQKWTMFFHRSLASLSSTLRSCSINSLSCLEPRLKRIFLRPIYTSVLTLQCCSLL